MSLPIPILVLHDLGDPLGGGPWRAALASAGWHGPVIAPDLPGHASTPARVGGSYESGDAILAALPLYRDLAEEFPAPVVVGVGVNGWAAHILALGGRTSGLVLVDGLNGPWRTPARQIATGRAWLRSIANDPAAIGAAPADGLDPRAAHRVPSHGSRRLALKAAAAMPVPALLLESPESPLTAPEVDEVAAAYRCGASVVRISAPTAQASVQAIVSRRELTLSDTSA